MLSPMALLAAVFFLLPALGVRSLDDPRATAAALQRYRILQANVDEAFLWKYLNQNKGNVRPASGRVRAVGSQIVKATGQSFLFNCHFYSVDSPLVNAVTSPKGNIFFYEGIFKLNLNEAETAAIIGHEVGHLVKSHWLARLRRSLQAAVLAQYAARKYGRSSGQIAYLYKVVQDLQYNRQEEYEADVIGAELLGRAGYPPEAMVSLLGKVYQSEQKKPAASQRNPYLLTHPLIPDRIAVIQSYIRSARPGERKKRIF